MVKVGLVGEDPNDTSSIKNLLEQRYRGKAVFLPIVKGVKGHQLGSDKIKNTLKVEFDPQKHQVVVFIRDLDAFRSQEDKLKERLLWFKELDAIAKNRGVLLLNIWELEALIFGDMETFNKVHGIKYAFKKDPTFVERPKERLKQITRHTQNPYRESHCPDLFKKLSIDKIEQKCSCFKEFIKELEAKLN